ncbi:MerR family transcriptional regulator [Hyphomonas sp. WL0036]|uniref:MerR family transcriptional regulator n=1 Tax=Hyphomonas sediminis TaxID=2866160 RepID=UPI001C7FEFE8|nr:MerR family transcriptional regulator [Hyphomonas sediminis]MBY9067063.1 MerR family transcriptional regulator [Hyphomonas sediminis]
MTALRARIEKSADAYRSIGEVAAELGLEPHVLRYWETRFPKQVSPVKRPDGRRFFRPQDLEALRAIQILVHERGMTLKGAKAVLSEQGVAAVLGGKAAITPGAAQAASHARALQETLAKAYTDVPADAEARRERLTETLSELSDLKSRLDALRARRAG